MNTIFDLVYFTIIILAGLSYIKWKKYGDEDSFGKMLMFLVMCIFYPYFVYHMQIGYYSNTYYVGARIHFMFNELLNNFARGDIDQILLGQERFYENEFLDVVSKIGMLAYLVLMLSITLALGTVVNFFKGLAGIIKR